MTMHLHTLPLSTPALPAIADWLLEWRPEARQLQQRAPQAQPPSPWQPDDLASVLVLLPSQRACTQLGHLMLEKVKQPALILPRIMTSGRLADYLMNMQGLDNRYSDQEIPLPDMSLRPLILAPRLAGLDWLHNRPEAALGLAGELINLFDELRLARCDALLLDGRNDDALLRHVQADAAPMLLADLQRLREAWHQYRKALPEDLVDRRLAALELSRRCWPGKKPSMIAAAHLGRLDQALIDLLRGAAHTGVPVHWLTAAADDPRSRLLLATYRDVQAATHPLQAIRQLATRLGLEQPPTPSFAGVDLPERLAALEEARDQLSLGGPIRLQSCRDPEHESRVVAEAVCKTLQKAQADSRDMPSILVATSDRELAARIAAQLRDAGLEIDDSRGRPLISLPAGRLLRDILRTAATGWPYAPLFEILTHPYVRLTDKNARPGHAVRVQVLEAAVRRSRGARRGLATLLGIAGEDDRTSAAARHGWSLRAFVSDIADRFAPLVQLANGPVFWQAATAAMAQVWAALAPDRSLDDEPDPQHDHDDLGATAGLLRALTEAAPSLPPAPLTQMTAEVNELLASPACEVRPLRQRYLPVRLVGLVEARLDAADLLVLAGMGQDVFPGRLVRPLLLPDHLRHELGLSCWRQQSARDAELFLRLMHVAPNMLITWPRERDDRQVLPSPLVQRLMLTARAEPEQADEPRLRRCVLPDVNEMADREARYRAEPEPIFAPLVKPPQRLSHSALQMYRDCPYRFMLAGGLRLRRADPLEKAHTAADAGTLAHRVMQRWLEPTGPGWKALARGDGRTALEYLCEVGTSNGAEQGADLPGAAVSLQALLALAPALVDFELKRAAVWQPAVLEAAFEVTLGQAAAWLHDNDPDHRAQDVAEDCRDVMLVGFIDRVDRRRDGSQNVAVIDYKTGRVPSKSQVRDGRELQIYLYALAVEAGTVEGLLAPEDGVWRFDHGAFYGLNRAQQGFADQPHLTDRKDLIAGVRAILMQALAIHDPEVPYALVPEWQAEDMSGQLPCRICEFRGICRLEERDTKSALAARIAALVTENPRRTA